MAEDNPTSPPHVLRICIVTGSWYYFLTSIPVLLGIWYGCNYLPRQLYPHEFGLLHSMRNWDGGYFHSIATEGYFYEPDRMSSVAFFPAYPVLVKVVHEATGLESEAALVIVSHVCLVASFILFAVYVRERYPDQPVQLAEVVLLSFGLWPTTMFFRMAYSESLCLLVFLAALYGMQRNWAPVWIALIIGLATACRPVGVALLPCFLLFLWQKYRTWTSVLGVACWAIPLSCWGIFAYAAFLSHEFEDPLAFVKTQSNWHSRPRTEPADQVVGLLTLEPMWSVYNPSSSAYWKLREGNNAHPLVSLTLANPIYFVAIGLLSAIGWYVGWLNSREGLLCLVLLLIPYLTHAYPNAMVSTGRYAAMAFPSFMVLGRLTLKHPWLGIPLYLLGAAMLAIYAARFSAWYFVI